MLSIPSIGLSTVAGFLAEVGDLSRFTSWQQIRKLAGLNLRENSSGKHKGQTEITKRGRARLRAVLYRAVFPSLGRMQSSCFCISTSRPEWITHSNRNSRLSLFVENSYGSCLRLVHGMWITIRSVP